VDVLGLPPQVLEDLYGGPVSPDSRSYEGKARMVWWHELLYAVCDSLGFCRFQTVFNSPHAPQYPQYREMIRLALDWDMSVEELRQAGERIYTTERLLLGRMGVGGREHDTLPRRWFEEPVAEGPCKGELIERPRFEKFLDEYYALHGWDNDGRPTPETVKRLGIP
jgi:aldehyde:ferredoxin oxidoreductase